jgi:putative sigma-54 modulation protein
MNIHVRSRQIEMDEAVCAHIDRRLQFSLGRYASRILRVTVQIIDLNGPRRGKDKSCRVEVRLLPRGSIFVEEISADLNAAVDRAADRVMRSVTRALERTRDLERDTGTSRRLVPASMASDVNELPTAWEDTRRQRKERSSQ